MIVRECLPNRRQCESFELSHAGLRFTLCTGFYPVSRGALRLERTMGAIGTLGAKDQDSVVAFMHERRTPTAGADKSTVIDFLAYAGRGGTCQDRR
jgi:hypothetical protein